MKNIVYSVLLCCRARSVVGFESKVFAYAFKYEVASVRTRESIRYS